MSNDRLQSLLIQLALLIFYRKCWFWFWLWGRTSKTLLFHACCQTEALTMRVFSLTTATGVGDVIYQRYQWIDIDLAALTCPDAEFSFSCCCSLQSEMILSSIWWGKVFPLLFTGRGNPPGRQRAGNNVMRRRMNFHIHLSVRAVSLVIRCPHCGLQAVTVSDPCAGNSVLGQERSVCESGCYRKSLAASCRG